MKYSELKLIANFCFKNEIDWKEVAEKIINEKDFFEVDNYKFISENEIDKLMIKELDADPWEIGYIDRKILSDSTTLSIEIIDFLKESSKENLIGNHIIENSEVKLLQKNYVKNCGYNAYFSDGYNIDYEKLLDVGYYAFEMC